jgi:2-oxoglutarate dehydrogenase E1 component
MCAQDNIQVANCTTPANYFHILRRQVRRNIRKPLVLMTPKSLLRHKRCVSSLADMSGDSSFHRVLYDDAEMRPTAGGIELKGDSKIRRVVLSSGKVYYDLFEEREARGIDDIQLLRIEQLHPFPAKSVLEVLRRFPKAEIVWCQEEPKNMGAWAFVDPYFEWLFHQLGRPAVRARYIGRAAMAATATGLMSKHVKELKAFLDEALGE